MSFRFITLIPCFVLANGVALAEPWSTSCADAIGHLRRAQADVHAKQVEVTKAKHGERLQVQKAEVCRLGGVIVAGRVAECVHLSREVPIAIQEITDAKADRQPALDAFEVALEALNRRCLQIP